MVPFRTFTYRSFFATKAVATFVFCPKYVLSQECKKGGGGHLACIQRHSPKVIEGYFETTFRPRIAEKFPAAYSARMGLIKSFIKDNRVSLSASRC